MISELLISGQSTRTVADEYDLDISLIRRWRKKYESEQEAFTGTGNPSLTEEQKEIKRLRKALKNAEVEREILKKAVAIFSARDSVSISS